MPGDRASSSQIGSVLTIRELAKRLKLGKTTIALALRGSPKVSAATGEWVRQQAQELGYVPNVVASVFLQQLRSKGSQLYRANLAFLCPRPIGPLAKCAYHGAQERARELGYGISVFNAAGFEGKKLENLLLARGISGIIVGPLEHAIGHLTLDWSKFSVTACGYSMARPAVHRVVHNHLHGIRMAFRMCRRKGYRRIGLAMSTDSDQRSSRQWSCGFLGLQSDLPAKDRVAPFLVHPARFNEKQISQWILQERPEVIIIHAAGCVPELSKMLDGLPFKVRCVVLDRLAHEAYAGIDQRCKDSGRMLVDSVSSQLLYNQRGIPKIPVLSVMEGVWVDHPSLA